MLTDARDSGCGYLATLARVSLTMFINIVQLIAFNMAAENLTPIEGPGLNVRTHPLTVRIIVSG